jgi:hypothetical protein
MTADLVNRLRGWLDEDVPIGVIMNEAADEIERLRAALEEYLDADDHLAKVMPECVAEGVIEAAIKRVRAAKKEARAALAEEKQP